MHNYIEALLGRKKRIYLDYAAATPVAPEVYTAMRPYFSEHFGNPSAIHQDGVFSKKVIEEARKELSEILKVRRTDIVFTSGGTESNHLAVHGTIEHLHQSGRAYSDMEIVTTRMEHPSVIESINVLKARGVVVAYVKPNEEGLIEEETLQSVLSDKTVLMTFSYVNSEIGVVQDVKRITRAVRKFSVAHNVQIKIHLDACQAPLWLPCQLDMLGVDMLTLDAGKCYGPKGVGVLAFRHGVSLEAQQKGGGQESGLRAGTENTALIVGCVCAIARAQKNCQLRSEAVAPLRDFFLTQLTEKIPDLVVNGSRTARVANNVNISIPSVDTEFAVIVLDTHGISASTKSACSGASGAGSKVVAEITNDPKRAVSTIRFTLGEKTTKQELMTTVRVLSLHVEKMQTFLKTQKTAV